MTNFRLPYIGAEAVVLGMAAFNANAATVQQQLNAMGRASYMMERTSRGAFQGFAGVGTNAMTAVSTGAMIATGVITALGAAAVLAGQRYERAMQNLGAISESTSSQINELGKAQLAVASNSTLSAMELAKASSEMVKAGVSIKDVTKDALSAVNDLLIISEGELKAADAGVALQVGMRNFHATAKQVVDTTTAAVLSSTLTFTGYAQAMKAAGPIAAQFGLSIEQFGAMVGTASLRIASGTEVGNGLRQMFLRLQAPSKDASELMQQYGVSLYDTHGAARPMVQIISDLSEQFSNQAVAAGKLTQQERDHALAVIFGTRAGRSATVVIEEGTQAYGEMLEEMKRLEASKIAETFLAQTGAKAEIAANRINVLGIAFGQGLDPFINSATSSLVKWLQSINDEKVFALGQAVGGALYQAFSNIGEIIGTVIIPAYERLFDAFGRLDTAIGKLINSSGLMSAIIQFIGRSMIGWAAITAATIDTLAALADMSAQVANTLDGYIDTVSSGFQQLGPVVAQAGSIVGEAIQQVVSDFVGFGIMLINTAGEITDALSANFLNVLGNVKDVAGGVLAAFALMASGTLPIFGYMVNAAEEAMNAILSTLDHAFGGWSGFWTAAQQAVVTAVQNILKTVNHLLDQMEKLPILGGIVGGARAAIGGFFNAIPKWSAQAGAGITKFTSGAGTAFTNFAKNIGRNVQDFTAQLNAINTEARRKRDEMLSLLQQKKKASPDLGDDTEPGFLPDKGAADKAAKQLQELLDKADELWQDFNKDIAKDQRKLTSDIVELYNRAADGMTKAMEKANKAITDAQIDAYNKVNQMASDKIFADREKALKKALEEEQKDTKQFREWDKEDAENAHKRDLDNDAIFAREQRQQREEEFDKYLAGMALRRDRDRQDEDRVFEASQQARADKLAYEQNIEDDALDKRLDTRERELKKEQDALERTLRADIDKREAALQAIQDAEDRALDVKLANEERALKKSQDQREAALQAILDAEDTTRQQQRDVAEINADDAAQRAVAQKEYNDEVAKGVKQSIAQTRLNEKLAKINKETTGKQSDLAQRQKAAQEDADFEAAQETRMAALRATFEAEDLAREKAADEAKLKLDQEHEAQTLALKVKTDGELLAQQASFEAATFELRKKNEEEKTRVQNEQEAARHALANKLEYEALLRSREREDEDREYSEEQTKRKNNFQKIEDEKARADARRIEDSERERTRLQQVADREFAEQQERDKEELEKKLDDEGYQRRVFQIGMEAMERINVAKSTLAEEQQLTRDKLAQDILDLEGNMEDRIKTIRESYLDKLQDIVKDGGAKLQPVVDEVTSNINDSLDGIRTAAEEATTALLAVFDAQRKLASSPPTLVVGNKVAGAAVFRNGEDPDPPYGTTRGNYTYLGGGVWAYDNSTDTGSQADDSLYSRYDRGGVIPGPWGQPVPIMAHGGERFEGIGAHAATLAAVRAAESMWSSGIGAGSTTNNYNYNVDANYSQVQSPSSVAQDLRALAILTRS